MSRDDSGEIAILGSMAGAALTGMPVAVLLSDNAVADNLSFLVAMFVSLLALGAGIGRIYKMWKMSVLESMNRDNLLKDLADRLHRIEERQIKIEDSITNNLERLKLKRTIIDYDDDK
jgi:hypothetical protein